MSQESQNVKWARERAASMRKLREYVELAIYADTGEPIPLTRDELRMISDGLQTEADSLGGYVARQRAITEAQR